MIKDIIDANKSADSIKIKLQKLRDVFPGAFHGETVDIEYIKNQLKAMKVTKEGYELNFLGKSYAKLLAALETETVIVPATEHNKKEENKNSENLYLTADNLDALKHLLKSYWRKIKVIYIDPPYNTGSDGFVYNDTFEFNKSDLVSKLGISEDEAERVVEMTNSESSSHSAWLTFMYPRLYLARQLLAEDGVIFISIDDHEQANLKLLCDDIFGDSNFINTVFWQRNSSGKTVSKQLQANVEYLMVYAKSENYNLNPVYKPLADGTIKMYSKDDCDGRGKYRLYPLQKTASPGPETTYDYVDNSGKVWKCPQKGWRMIRSKLKALENDGRLYFQAGALSEKAYWDERDSEGKLADTLWNDLSENSSASKALASLLGVDSVFDSPKPIDLIGRCIEMFDGDDIYVLDFFSGSASTAHSVLDLNATDGKKRHYIMIQLSEKTDEKSVAYQNGYKTIDQIGIKRIIEASKTIKDALIEKKRMAGLIMDGIVDSDSVDLGFKHFHVKPITNNQLSIMDSFNPEVLMADKGILDEFGVETVLTTWKNYDGYGLSNEWNVLILAGYTAYQIDRTVYLLNPELSDRAMKAFLELYENDFFNCNKIVLFGYSFTMSEIQSIKDNLKQIEGIKHLTLDILVRY